MDKVIRLTLEDITRAKLQRDKDKLTVKEIEVPSLGKALLFKRPTDEMILDYIEAAGEDASPRNMVRHYEEIIYMCCEMLQNPELHEELEVVDPIDTVKAFMDANDVLMVGDELCDMNSLYHGYSEEVKNS